MSNRGDAQINLIGGERPDATIDVLFIHGIGGDPNRTWQYDKGSFWPKWLADDVPWAQVWVADYPAAPTLWDGRSLNLLACAKALLDRMQGKLGRNNRRIVLIGHSLGGLVAKQMLRTACDISASDAWKALGSSVCGVVFPATPHSGSDLASFLTNLVKAMGALGWISRSTELLNELRADSPQLDDLSAWYRAFVGRNQVQTAVYFEGRPVKGSVIVVGRAPSNPNLDGVTPIELALDHWEVCKPRDRTAHVYEGVRRFVEDQRDRWVQVAVLPPLPPPHPVLSLRLIRPANSIFKLPNARDKEQDVQARLATMAKAHGLHTLKWVRETLARVYRDLDAQNQPHQTYFTFNRNAIRFPLTEAEDYAIGLHDWYLYTDFNLGVEHENETAKARTVIVSLSFRKRGWPSSER